MSLLEQQDLYLLEPQVWQRCVVDALEFNPIQGRDEVAGALGWLATKDLEGEQLAERDRDSLDRKFIGAYRLNDLKDQFDRDELLGWLGIDGDYMLGAESHANVLKPYRDGTKVIVPSEPLITIERRDMIAFKQAGMSVVSVLFSLATLNIDEQHAAEPNFDSKLAVGELVAFKKVNFKRSLTTV